jgi:hypothetical protein
MATITFPPSLRTSGPNGEGLPTIRFSASKKGVGVGEFENVQLYMPQGLQFQDSAQYNNIDLGVIQAARQIGNTATSGKEFKDAVNPDQVMVAGLKLADKLGADQSVTGSQALAQGVAFNPQTALAFEGVNLRTFSFAFTLVPESEKESKSIRDIESFFRKYLYPEVTGFVARYPPIFSIRFYDGQSDTESRYLPMIHDSYLTGVDVQINPEGNSFHRNSDGYAPTAVQLTLSFAEGRMLSRHDIYRKDSLEYDYSRPNSAGITAETATPPEEGGNG